jgi:membrane protein involved in colicin uptake
MKKLITVVAGFCIALSAYAQQTPPSADDLAADKKIADAQKALDLAKAEKSEAAKKKAADIAKAAAEKDLLRILQVGT